MPPAAKILDRVLCPLVTPMIIPIPHIAGGIIIDGCFTVLISGLPAATVGKKALCMGPPPHPCSILMGSFTVLIEDRPAARMGSITDVGGMVEGGDITVEIGE